MQKTYKFFSYKLFLRNGKGNNRFLLYFLFAFSLLSLVFRSTNLVKADLALESFVASSANQQVILEWEKISDIEIVGFYVTSNNHQEEDYSRINYLIVTHGSQLNGLIYQNIEPDLIMGKVHYIKFETADSDNNSDSFDTNSRFSRQLNFTSNQAEDQMTTTPSFTPSTTSSRTLTQFVNLTKDQTATQTSTSQFSFLTNTPTPTTTSSPKITQTSTQENIPDYTITPENSRTLEIIIYNSFIPTNTIAPEEINPFKEGFVGFILTLLIGLLIILVLVFLKKGNKSI